MLSLFNSNQQLEFAQAEVIGVDYSGYYKTSGYYTVACRILNSKSDNDKITAIPLDYNIKKVPIVGEIVMLVAAASSFSDSLNLGKSYYYLNTIPVHKSYNHNALPTVSSKNSLYYNQTQSDANGFATGRIQIKQNADPEIDTTFNEPELLKPLQLFSGDIVIDGRFGNSIRFGSTLKPDHPFAIAPAWSRGNSSPGNPILIISNGRNRDTQNNTLSMESINDDASSIWLTAGQQVFFTPSTLLSNLIRNNKLDSGFRSNFSGNQIFVNSDRVNINSKKFEVNISSRGGVSVASDKSIIAESSGKFEVEASRINLGINASHPALLGDITFDLLTELINTLMNLCDQLTQEVHPTGVGPSGPPQNLSEYISIKNTLNNIKNELPKIKSNLVFVNKSVFASDELDKASKDEFKENIR